MIKAAHRPLAFSITEEMINTGLKGNELILFSFLDYKCNHSMNGCYTGGLVEIELIFKLSQPTIIRIINLLVKYGLIEKTYYLDGNNCKRLSIKMV